jgi:hypothetical protein
MASGIAVVFCSSVPVATVHTAAALSLKTSTWLDAATVSRIDCRLQLFQIFNSASNQHAAQPLAKTGVDAMMASDQNMGMS